MPALPAGAALARANAGLAAEAAALVGMSEWDGAFLFTVASVEPNTARGVAIGLRGTHGSWVTIELFKTKHGAWTWRWAETWLGQQTVLEPRRSWWHRDKAVDHLAQTVALFRLPHLAETIDAHWR